MIHPTNGLAVQLRGGEWRPALSFSQALDAVLHEEVGPVSIRQTLNGRAAEVAYDPATLRQRMREAFAAGLDDVGFVRRELVAFRRARAKAGERDRGLRHRQMQIDVELGNARARRARGAK